MKAKPSGWLAAALFVVLLPIAGWSAFWFYARARAEAELATLAAAPAGSAVRLNCAERKTGGYPFSLLVTCLDPSFVVAGDAGPVDIRFSQLVATASLLSPQAVQLDLVGPLTASDGRGQTRANWTAMRLAVDGALPDVRRFGVHGTNFNLACDACYEPLRASHADAFDLTFERGEGTRASAFAITSTGLANALLLALTSSDQPAAFAARGTITQFEFPRSLRLVAEVERWRAAGGSLTVEQASLDQGAMHVQVSGDFALDALHRPTGTFQAGARNAATLISGFTGSLSPLLQLAIGAALRGIDSATAKSSEKLDIALPGRLENGALSLGPLRGIASVKPLY